jgi:predicted PurR-regulated permease PerM
MSTANNEPPPATPDGPRDWTWQGLLKTLAVWGLFLLLVYLARDFFFTAFMTFMFCYLTLALVGLGMRWLAGGRERPGLRRLLTVAVFVLVPLALAGVGTLLAPRVIAQGQHFAGWLSRVSPESEVAHLLEEHVGPSEFRREYGGPQDERYQKALEEFRKGGARHVAEYNQFPRLEAWVDGGFSRQFADAESGRIRVRLTREGTSSKEFEDWFVKEKFPELQRQAREQAADKGGAAPASLLVRAAASSTPEQTLQAVRRDPALLAALRAEWFGDALERGLAAARASPAYLEQLREHYEARRRQSPDTFPYTFEQYVELQKVRPQGPVAFGTALEKMRPSAAGEGEARLRADFEAAKTHALFTEWWGTNSTARFIRHQVESHTSGGDTSHMDRVLASLLNVPVDLTTALLISFFICIDYPRLSQGVRRLRETWLRDVFEALAVPLSSLGQLMGRAMQAQALIALCNAVLLFVALTVLGVEHADLLALAVFVLCQVPTLGTLIAWALLAAVALLQPGGGLVLALKVTGAVVVVVLLETFVFSPRILGRMMELHPVLLMAILPLAQYFFGIWGLLLATPVAVYVVHVLILRRGLPGIDAPAEAAAAGPVEVGSRDVPRALEAAEKAER